MLKRLSLSGTWFLVIAGLLLVLSCESNSGWEDDELPVSFTFSDECTCNFAPSDIMPAMNQVNVYPNPFVNMVNIYVYPAPEKVIISDKDGRMKIVQAEEGRYISIDFSECRPGIYQAQIVFPNQTVKTQLFKSK